MPVTCGLCERPDHQHKKDLRGLIEIPVRAGGKETTFVVVQACYEEKLAQGGLQAVQEAMEAALR
jgi:hypothetical protein